METSRFFKSVCKSNVLKPILSDVIRKLRDCNAMIHALISDMGSNFTQLCRELDISVQNSIFLVDEHEVYIFDTPHLMKRTRDNLFKYNIQFENNKVVSWADFVEFYNKDRKHWIKMASKLSKNHIEPVFKK